MPVLEKSFGTDQFSVTYFVDEPHAGMRFDQFLLKHLRGFSREQVKKKIASGEIAINNRPESRKPSCKLHLGDKITFCVNNTIHEDEWWNGEKLELDGNPETIYEDNDLIVINKPPYMATHPTGRHLFNCATVLLENRFGHTIHSIHRIDRETSGVLLLGKNPQTASVLGMNFEEDRVRKVYFWMALATKEINEIPDDFMAKERLGGNETGLRRVITKFFPETSHEGKEAQTLFHVLHKNSQYLLGMAFPVTGRTHQIRVHALAHGFPLIGDKLYLGGYKMFQRFKDNLATPADHELMELPRHALHALALNFPYKNQSQTLFAEIPKDFKDWIHLKMPEVDITLLTKKMKEKIDHYFSTLPE